MTTDATMPPAPSAPDLAGASDTGSSGSDDLTSVTVPTVIGSDAGAGATVTLYDTDGTTLLGIATADGSGNWSITSAILGDGAHALTATQPTLRQPKRRFRGFGADGRYRRSASPVGS